MDISNDQTRSKHYSTDIEEMEKTVEPKMRGATLLHEKRKTSLKSKSPKKIGAPSALNFIRL